MDPIAELQDVGEIFDNSRSRFAKKIHGCYKKNGINDTGDNNPFPQLVLQNKTMGFTPGLDVYYYFFKQDLILKGKYSKER